SSMSATSRSYLPDSIGCIVLLGAVTMHEITSILHRITIEGSGPEVVVHTLRYQELHIDAHRTHRPHQSLVGIVAADFDSEEQIFVREEANGRAGPILGIRIVAETLHDVGGLVIMIVLVHPLLPIE